ncbi:MAG: hypothetical protein U9N59_11710 [Campylobacterota bacterium]|nr:hypothetical protein [Campylobacterota bacterium]
MHLDMTPEVIVSQLGLGSSNSVMEQTTTTINNTKDFDKFSKHIISLNDKLKHMHAYVALSNSESYFKVKCENTDSAEIIKEFNDELDHWSDKYDVSLRKVDNKEVYYIIGKN